MGYIGIGTEVGVLTDIARLKIEIYCSQGIVLGWFSRTAINLDALVAPGSCNRS